MKNTFFYNIIGDCLKLISEKKINVYDLSFEMGISYNRLINILSNPNDDLIVYLKLYDTLLEW